MSSSARSLFINILSRTKKSNLNFTLIFFIISFSNPRDNIVLQESHLTSVWKRNCLQMISVSLHKLCKLHVFGALNLMKCTVFTVSLRTLQNFLQYQFSSQLVLLVACVPQFEIRCYRVFNLQRFFLNIFCFDLIFTLLWDAFWTVDDEKDYLLQASSNHFFWLVTLN